MEPLADLRDARDQVLPDLVHDVVAEPLQQAHDGLGLAEERLLLRAHQPLEPVLAVGLAADGSPQAAERLTSKTAGVTPEQRQLAFQPLGEVRPEPRMRLELEGMGGLVERDPRPERPDRHAEPPGCGADVLLDE